jgi:hypothetical protein
VVVNVGGFACAGVGLVGFAGWFEAV